jgi:hypothetical protein
MAVLSQAGAAHLQSAIHGRSSLAINLDRPVNGLHTQHVLQSCRTPEALAQDWTDVATQQRHTGEAFSVVSATDLTPSSLRAAQQRAVALRSASSLTAFETPFPSWATASALPPADAGIPCGDGRGGAAKSSSASDATLTCTDSRRDGSMPLATTATRPQLPYQIGASVFGSSGTRGSACSHKHDTRGIVPSATQLVVGCYAAARLAASHGAVPSVLTPLTTSPSRTNNLLFLFLVLASSLHPKASDQALFRTMPSSTSSGNVRMQLCLQSRQVPRSATHDVSVMQMKWPGTIW